MSYEELLALSEAIGDVKSKGMSEGEIDRLPTTVFEKVRAEGEPQEQAEGDGAPVDARGRGQGSEGGKGDGKEKKKSSGWFFSRGKKSSSGKRDDADGKSGSAKEEKTQPSPPSHPSHSSHSPPSQPSQAPQSLSPSSPAPDVAKWRETCSICLEPFRNGDLLKWLPCFHPHHQECVDNWLLVNASCPICKEKPVVH